MKINLLQYTKPSVIQMVELDVDIQTRFEADLQTLKERCFHMSDAEASVEVEAFIMDNPYVIGLVYDGTPITKQWLIANS